MNEESERTTFQNRRGSSNIDLTVVNTQLLKALKNWEISEDESCSDHSIIKFGLRKSIYHDTKYNYNGHRYVVTDENLKTFDNNLSQIVAMKFCTGQEDSAKLDRVLASQVKESKDLESAVDLFQEALISSWNKTFKTRWATKKTTKYKSVPWWTEEITLKRKRINALRRRYQRTTNDDDLRERRKNQYHDEKSKYQAAIKGEKIKSWKEFRTLTSPTNPWNAVYKLASNKAKRSQPLSTLQKPGGSLTTVINETEYLISKDKEDNNSDYHNTIRTLTETPIQTANGREYTPEEMWMAIEAINSKKAPGEDRITSDIFQHSYKQFPNLINTLYNECFRQGCFPKRRKRVKVIPITNPGKAPLRDCKTLTWWWGLCGLMSHGAMLAVA
jgi:type II secretory pathway component PulJ